ncbi:MAG: hypothetical protein Q7V63_00095 [Gammaproteobacteria bacterium]|nr:hypothetical protein [Gammaproteobacteria bacterium]
MQGRIKMLVTGMNGTSHDFMSIACGDSLDLELPAMATIGVDFRIISLSDDDEAPKVNLWDIAGLTRYRSIINAHLRNAQAILLLADLNYLLESPNAFITTINEWAELFPTGIIVPVQAKDDIAHLDVLRANAHGLRIHEEIIDIRRIDRDLTVETNKIKNLLRGLAPEVVSETTIARPVVHEHAFAPRAVNLHAAAIAPVIVFGASAVAHQPVIAAAGAGDLDPEIITDHVRSSEDLDPC